MSLFVPHSKVAETPGFKIQARGVAVWEDLVDEEGNVEVFSSEPEALVEVDSLGGLEERDGEYQVVPTTDIAPSSR